MRTSDQIIIFLIGSLFGIFCACFTVSSDIKKACESNGEVYLVTMDKIKCFVVKE